MLIPSCALESSQDCFNVVNASGLGFHTALQVVVAQGIANRIRPSVFVIGMERLPGMIGIEWFPGTGCTNCHGLQERWLDAFEKDVDRCHAMLSPKDLLTQTLPLFSGAALYSPEEPHSLGPVMTACGVQDLLPATEQDLHRLGLRVRFDARQRWADALSAAWFTARELLAGANKSTLAIQAPTNLPFLADAIVSWRLPLVWMDDMCHNADQNAVLRYTLERHFGASPSVQYLGWFNHTRRPNVELLCQCTEAKRLITVASDWAENLSFLSRLGQIAVGHREAYVQPPDAVTVSHYSTDRTYVAILVSDGDNLAQDLWNLRPMLERRLQLRSRVPMSWTVSNRWLDFGRPVLDWFYDAAASTGGYDSFLMGPSGFGYLFPGQIKSDEARFDFARKTARAARQLDMQAYVHWDQDQPYSRERTEAAVALYNGTAIRGAFMLGSNPIANMIGDVVAVNKPALPWGFQNASAAAIKLNELPLGSITYVYFNMKADPSLVDELAARLEPRVVLLGHRELIRVARLAHKRT